MLFTDIEGSTRLLRATGDLFGDLIELHNDVLRTVFAEHGGVEVHAAGDSFFVAFDSATAGVGAAAAAQRSLGRQEWPGGETVRVRIGVHTGEPVLAGDDYAGLDVHRAARIAAAAHGGQILMSGESAAAAGLVAGPVVPELDVRPLGAYRLKDLPDPEDIFQLVVAGTLQDFPPIREHATPSAAQLPDYDLPPADIPCPYKGLAAFQPEDAALFFGRTRLVADALRRLSDFPFLCVVGASGSGKSSFVRAGIVPGLLASQPGVHPALFVPGADPLAALTAVLDRPPAGAPAVIVVDQLEELFTAASPEPDREAFLARLLDLRFARDTRVVASLRADFYGHCARYRKFAQVLQDHQLLLGAMDEAELREAIERPARAVGLTLEPGLVQTVLRDVAGEPGALPLLSHSLLETWRQRSGSLLPVLGYVQSGGVAEALATTSEAVFEALPPGQQRLARNVFLRLTTPGESGEDTRRRVARDELVLGEDADEVTRLLEALANARLVTMDDATVEVAHEALIRHWPRLRGWLDADREGLRTHRHLTEASREWLALGRDEGSHYRGARLAAAVEWADARAADLNELEREFLDASVASENDELATTRRRNRRLKALASGLAVLLVAAAVSAGIALQQSARAREQGAVALSRAVAAEARDELDRQLDRALLLALEAYRQAPTPEARSALNAAVQRTAHLEAIVTGATGGLAFSPDGQLMVSADEDNALLLWDAARGGPAERLPIGEVAVELAFSPDGTRLAAATGDDNLVLVDVRRRIVERTIAAHDGQLDGVAFAPDGQTVTTVGVFDGTARRWDVATGEPRAAAIRLATAANTESALSSTNELVAFASTSGAVALVDTVGGTTRELAVGGGVEEIALDPTGQRVAVAPETGGLELWDIATGRLIGERVDWDGEVLDVVAFSPDGLRLAAGLPGGRVRFGDGRTGAPTGPTRAGHTADITTMAFDASERLVTVGLDGAVIVWPAEEAGAAVRTFPERNAHELDVAPGGHLAGVERTDHSVEIRRLADGAGVVGPLAGRGVAFVADGQQVAVLPARDEVDGEFVTPFVALIDLDGRTVATLRGPVNDGFGVAASGDGTHVAVWDSAGNVSLWSLPPAAPRHRRVRAHDAEVWDAVFSPDSATLATVGQDGAVRLWDVAEGEPLGAPLQEAGGGESSTVVFTPDGRTLVVAHDQGMILRFDVERRRAIGTPFQIGREFIFALDVSPDGTVLAIVSADSAARTSSRQPTLGLGESRLSFWDLQRGEILGAPIDPGDDLGDGEFTRDGRSFVTVGGASLAVWDSALWSADADVLAARVCALTSRDLTRDEWTRALPDVPYRSSCDA